MPVYINEVIVEVENQVTQPTESQPLAQQQPLSVAESELAVTLEQIQQRQARLQVD
jgi:hypothetical protein